MTVIRKFTLSEPVISKLVVDNVNNFVWIAYQQSSDGFCHLQKVCATDFSVVYIDIPINAQVIVDLFVASSFGYILVLLEGAPNGLIAIQYSVFTSLNPYYYYQPYGINTPIKIVSDLNFNNIYILIPSSSGGNNSKILQYSTYGAGFQATINLTPLLPSAETIVGEDSMAIDIYNNIWIATNSNTLKIIRVWYNVSHWDMQIRNIDGTTSASCIYDNTLSGGTSLYVVTNTSPAKIIQLDVGSSGATTTNPYIKILTLTGYSFATAVTVDTKENFIYVSCASGQVIKIPVGTLSTAHLGNFSNINLVDSNNLLNMGVLNEFYLSYTSTTANGVGYIIDERKTIPVATNFVCIGSYGYTINTFFNVNQATSVNTNFVCTSNNISSFNTNFVVLSQSYNSIAPLGRIDWHVWIDGVQLDATDLELNSITIIHGAQSLYQKSRATFTLTRRHDAINTTYSGNTVTITAQNVVQIYIGTHLEFSGQVAELNCTYNKSKELVEVLAYMSQPTPQYNSVVLPLPSLNEKLHLYHVLMENPRIYNPYINPDDQAPEKYLGVKIRLGDWTVEHIAQSGPGPTNLVGSTLYSNDTLTLAEQITAGLWFPQQNYTYFWFVDATTITISPNGNESGFINVTTGNVGNTPQGSFQIFGGTGLEAGNLNNLYVGTSLGGLSSRPYQLNNVTYLSQRDLPNEYFHLGSGTVTQADLESLYPGYGSTLFSALQTYGYLSGTTITQKFQTSIYPAPATTTFTGSIVGTLSGFGLNPGGYNEYFFIGLGQDLTQRAYSALINALGYTLGNPPYKNISARSGIYEAVLRYTDGPDGLYHTINSGYNFQIYNQLVAQLEYQKLQTINGTILPITTTNFEITLDAYYYYNIYLLTRINVSNTTTPNIYNNNNGFPVEVKTITLSSKDMTVKLETGNEKSAIELQALDAQMPLTDDYIYSGQSILINPKYDLQNQVIVS